VKHDFPYFNAQLSFIQRKRKAAEADKLHKELLKKSKPQPKPSASATPTPASALKYVSRH